MKTSTKKLILISLCLVIAGVILLGVGMLFGGRPGVVFSRKGISSPYADNKSYVLEKTKINKFSDVDIKVGSYADIQILPSGDDQFYLEYELDGNYSEPSYDVRKNTLTLTHTENPRHYGINFFYFGSFSSSTEIRAYIKLYIPEDADMGNLNVYNDSGNVSIEGLAFEDTKLEVSYGDVKLQDMSFQDLELDMESGKLKAKNLTTQDLLLKNEYGDVTLEKITAQDVEIKLESGNLKADGFTSVNLTAKADYGDIEMEDFSTETADFVLSSGNLRMEAKELTSLICKNEYGDVKLKLPKDLAEYSVSARSEYGHIDLPEDAPGQHISSDDEAIYKTDGKSEGMIKIEVESGNIVIE